jgi:gamma-glutamylcyclotransferase (GGCT)/AIG2-like uncharacterized protein YtfP
MTELHGTQGTFLLFVYGTLKRGGIRHGALARARPRGEAHTRPHYALYDLGEYPGLKEVGDEGQAVHGELYEVDRRLIYWLDRMEGAPDWFALGRVELAGRADEAWAYFYQGDASGKPRVASGRWENAPGKGGGP